uniref:Insulin-like domain-containing protein n=1 Tax=Onchocerca volvulus TaxID=6282 RepID=A0A8R1Y037_ONCVO
MEYRTATTFLLLGIIGIQWSIAEFSTDICIDRVSSLIMSICNGCVQITIPLQYSDSNIETADKKELLHNVAEKCCYKRCFMRYFRSLCCST